MSDQWSPGPRDDSDQYCIRCGQKVFSTLAPPKFFFGSFKTEWAHESFPGNRGRDGELWFPEPQHEVGPHRAEPGGRPHPSEEHRYRKPGAGEDS